MTTFKIGFDGPSVKNGEIDIADLAPSLLALGEFFTSANHALNQDRADAKLRIRATEKGSFVALLSLDISFITDMLDAISTHEPRIVAANQLLALIIKGGTITGGTFGFFKALKFLNGKRPDSSQKNPNGTTSITVDGTTIEVDNRIATLLEDFGTREATEKFVKTALKPDGVRSVSFDEIDDHKDHDEPALVLTRADMQAVQIPEPSEDEITTKTLKREALLKIVSAQFEEGYLWRFSDGTNTFTASMADSSFVDRLDKSEVSLSRDDTLRCLVEETQTLIGSRLKTEASIIEVTDHISGARQLKLF